MESCRHPAVVANSGSRGVVISCEAQYPVIAGRLSRQLLLKCVAHVEWSGKVLPLAVPTMFGITGDHGANAWIEIEVGRHIMRVVTIQAGAHQFLFRFSSLCDTLLDR